MLKNVDWKAVPLEIWTLAVIAALGWIFFAVDMIHQDWPRGPLGALVASGCTMVVVKYFLRAKPK